VATSAAAARADLFFHFYYQLGTKRNLRRLHSLLVESGVAVSLATLKRYSAQFHWQARSTELDAEVRRRQREQDVADNMAMHDRHAQLGRAMQGAAGSALQRLLSNDVRLAGLKPSEIARLIDIGLRAERSAVGVSTDRREIAIDAWNDVVVEVVQIFLDINEEPDQATRARRFSRRIDRLVDDRLAAYERSEQ
jgi:hypothetical protein